MRRACAAVPLRRRRAAVPLRRWRTRARCRWNLLEKGDTPSQRRWCRRCAFDSLCGTLASSLSHNRYHASSSWKMTKYQHIQQSNNDTYDPNNPKSSLAFALGVLGLVGIATADLTDFASGEIMYAQGTSPLTPAPSPHISAPFTPPPSPSPHRHHHRHRIYFHFHDTYNTANSIKQPQATPPTLISTAHNCQPLG